MDALSDRQPNPYEPRADRSFDPPLQAKVSWGFGLGIAYPLLVLGAFHLTWIIAWCVLGHPPRPMRDDPKNIHALFFILYVIPGLLLALSPGVLLIAIGGEIIDGGRRGQGLFSLLRLGLVLLVCGAAVVYLRWDPLRVVEWYMD
jgi:hypothetical protein